MNFAEEYRNHIISQINDAVHQLDRTSIDPSRVAFLLNEKEIKELTEYTAGFSYLVDRETTGTITHYRGIAIRKR